MGKNLRNLFVYGLGSAANAAMGFVLLPLYLRYFNAGEFGIISVLLVVLTFAVMLAGAGMMSALHKQYFAVRIEQRKILVGTVVFWFLGAMSVVSALFLVLGPYLSRVLFDSFRYSTAVGLLAPVVLFTLAIDIPFNLLRLEKKAGTYVLFSIVRLLVEVGFKYLFIVSWRHGINGYFESSLFSLVIMNIILFFVTRQYFVFRLDWVQLKLLLQLGLPFIITGFSIWSLNAVDRLCLNFILGGQATGLYATAGKFAQIFDIFVFVPFSLLMPPVVFSFLHNHDNRENRAFFRVFFRLIAVAGCLGATVVIAASPDLIRILVSHFGANPQYLSSVSLVPPLVVAKMLYLFTMPCGYLALMLNRTRIPAIMAIVAVLVNLFLNLVLICFMGIIGAGIATAVAFLCYVVGTYVILNRFFSVPYDFGQVLILLVGSAVVAGVLTAIPLLNPLSDMLIKSMLTAGFVLSLAKAIGFFRTDKVLEAGPWSILAGMNT